jgi:hypothetical protein
MLVSPAVLLATFSAGTDSSLWGWALFTPMVLAFARVWNFGAHHLDGVLSYLRTARGAVATLGLLSSVAAMALVLTEVCQPP